MVCTYGEVNLNYVRLTSLDDMSLTENWEEFIVCREKVDFIDSLKGKIERLFGTRIYFTEVSRDGDKEKRWVKVTGGKWDRQNAKTYILGISDPEETKTVKCLADFLDDEIFENIERNTQAVLEKPSKDVIKISGSELAVTLALSALEELTGSVEENGSPSASETRERSASKRLDEKLDDTFGEGQNSYHSYPSSIKRVFLECGNHLDADGEDVNEEMLHGNGIEPKRKTSSEVILRKKEENDQRKNLTAPICRKDVDVADGKTNEVSSVTEQFPSAAQISPARARSCLGAGEDSLRDLAKKVGYTDEEVDEGFLYVNPPMKPTDFLDVLKTVKEEKQKIGLSDSGEKSGSQSSDQQESVLVVSDEDDEIMIVEDHFKQSNDTRKPKRFQGGLSNKQKKKIEQQQTDLAKQFEHQQSKAKPKNQSSPKSDSSSEAVDSSSKGNKFAKDKNISGTKRKSDPDSDQEQTSVMKVWEPVPASRVGDVRNQPRLQRIVDTRGEPVSEGLPMDQVQQQQQQLQQALQQMQQTNQRMSGLQTAYPNCATHLNGDLLYQGNVHHNHTDGQQLPPDQGQTDNLRYVIVDGSNVAMFHGNSKIFSCKGIQIAVDFFLDRGHKVTVFVPEWRKYRNQNMNRIRDQEVLTKLEDAGHLVFTPSRKINGKLVASYDDRFILSLAEKEDSVILSNDQYRDLMSEKASWKKIVHERLLMYRFVGDHFMPAEDPLGRDGPMLDEFLKKQPSITQSLQQRVAYQSHHYNPSGFVQPQRLPVGHWQTDGSGQTHVRGQSQGPWVMRGRQQPRFQQAEKARRHEDVTAQLLSQLKNVFSEPWQEEKLQMVLDNHSSETDLNRLTNYCMEVIFQ